MKVICGDIETDGLLSELTKLHCAGFDSGSGVSVFTNMQDVKSYLDLNKDVPVVMHNGICFDKPAMSILGYDLPNMVIDTLAISWYLYPNRAKHGLESWGEELGIMKPVVTDWSEQSIEVYIDRVTEDTKIQKALWSKFYKELYDIYGSDKEILRLLKYLNFKMKCLMVQERNGVRVDEEKLQKLLKDMLALQEEKKSELQSVLPQVPKYVEKTIPKVLRKMNGELSSHGVKWFELLKEHNLPESHTGPVKVLKEHVPPNANSHSQIKDWLYSFGWKPETYKYVRNKETNENRKIPQITDNDGDVCPSISKLASKIPEVRCLEGLGVLQHRISVLNGFIRDMQDGKLRARSMGFTNTLRMRHTELANIPSGRKPYGADIRSLITTDSGYVYIGADLSSLEDRIKHHYQWDYDPEYVKTQMEDGYDPHLLMCVLAGLLTEEQAQAHKDKLADYSSIRHQGKGTNYSCQYSAGAETVARAAGVDKKTGIKLHKAYNDLNWSIKAIADNTTVKTVNGTMWQYNPISKLWYYLKVKKDRFSTLVQGSAAFVFDMWLVFVFDECNKRWGVDAPLVAQFHDELLLVVKDNKKSIDTISEIVNTAVTRVNKMLLLNRDMACDIKSGYNYYEVH
jgi:DNA polymerase I-like protein with 3'-5' exonuclease and polymerase domains